MERWEHVRTLDVAQRATLLAILAEQEIALGREAIDENRRRSIQHGSTGDYWLKYHDDELVNVAVIERGPHTPTLELVGGNFDLSLYETLAREGSAEVLWWMRDGSSPSIPFQSVRSLRYLEARLDSISNPSPLAHVRGFVAGADDAEWIDANNAAFADHPEQGRWEIAELHSRLEEQWFDPSGFFVLMDEGKIAASCWTKIHELPVVRTGEIYVIFVTPAFQGRGYGEVILHHGLSSIRSRGVTVASLYVEDTNEAALNLYAKYGFTTKRLDQLVSINR